MLLLPQVLEQDARHVAFVAALDEHRAVPAVVGVYECAEGKAAKVPTVSCLQEARGTGLEHELNHFLAAAARHVHTVVICNCRHRRCHVPVKELKPRGVDVIPDHVCAYMLTRMCVCVHVCAYMYTHVRICTCMCEHVHACA